MTTSDDVLLLQAHNLSVVDGIRHGFFGRTGGVSNGIYASLNLGPGSGDIQQYVRSNRNIAAQTIGTVSEDHLVSLHQIHSSDVVFVDSPTPNSLKPKGDAMVTNVPGLALCILTADCTPVLLIDPNARVIGAAHAGWKGALAGVLENTIAAMMKLGANPCDMVAAIGPSLSQDSFEVGPDLKTPFIEKHDWCETLFRPGNEDRSHFDLWRFCEGVLLREGVSNVDTLGEDTLSQPDLFFSNRWRVQNNLSDYGRNGSAIMITEESS